MGIKSWWQEQKRNYNYQKALAERDKYIQQTLKEVDTTNREIDGIAKFDNYAKEERKLDYLRLTTMGENGTEKRFGDLQGRVTQSMEGQNLAPEGKGIGGFFGRLFNGRMSSASLAKSREGMQRFTTEVRFTKEQSDRLSYLTERKNTLADLEKTEKAAREADKRIRLEESKKLLRDAKNSPLSPDRTSELREAAIQALHREDPQNYSENRGEYAYERQATAFLKADDLEHNKKVMRVLKNVDFDRETVMPWMKEIVGSVQNMNMKDLDIANDAKIRENYPKIERLMYQVHLLKDLKMQMTPDEVQDVFGTPEQQKEYGRRLLYIGGVRAHERSKLLEEVGNEDEYTYSNEKGKVGGASKYYRKVADGRGGLWESTSFQELCEKQDEFDREQQRLYGKKEVNVDELSGKNKPSVTKIQEPLQTTTPTKTKGN